MTFGRSFLPGPTDIRPEVFDATVEPLYFQRSPRMQALIASMQPGLRRMFGTSQPVFHSTTSGSGLLEASIRNGVAHRVLVVVGGFFGELYATIAECCGKEVIRAMVPPGRVIEPDQLAQFLEGPPVDAVALVHSESSTGALADLPALAAVVRKHDDVLLLVDGITSVGAIPIESDAWGIDFICTGSQKSLALPPGLAVGVVSQRFLGRALSIPDRGWYMSIPNMVQTAEDGLPLHTPALPLYHALAYQLQSIEEQGGFSVRWERHAEMLRVLEAWVADRDIEFLATAGRRSPAISALRLRAGRSPAAVHAALAEQGWSIALGLGPLSESTIRIGHMGDLTSDHLRGLLDALDPLI